MVPYLSFRRRPMVRSFGLAILPVLLALGCAWGPAVHDPHVVVMNFENTIVDHGSKAYSPSLAEMMTACLVNYPRVVVVERQDLDYLFNGIKKNPSRWRVLGRKAGVDYVIVGSIGRLDRNYILNARLLSVETGEIVHGSSITRYCKREEDLYPVIQAMSRIMAYNLKYLAEYFEAQARGEQAPPKEEIAPAPPISAPPVNELP
jgi:TolB-like protein